MITIFFPDYDGTELEVTNANASKLKQFYWHFSFLCLLP